MPAESSSTPPSARRAAYLPFALPSITEEEIEAVADTLRSNWITTGPRTKQFEKDFAAYVGAKTALALNSCTAGLHLALVMSGVGPGDEVITTPMTFAASVNVIEHVGARPVLVDVEPETLLIDPARVAEAITPRSKAILPVHYAGHPADMNPLLELARQHGLRLIEDAAHAMPAWYDGRQVGSIGDFTSFSFYATKNITTADGGMLTGSEEMIERARILSFHGMSRDAWLRHEVVGGWYYDIVAPGFKYNMTDIQAALGMVQLRRLEEMQARRREVVAQYNAAFSQDKALQIPTERPNVKAAWYLYVLRLNLDRLTIDRDRFINELKARNIGSSVHYIPIHMHPYYHNKYGWSPESLPVTYREYHRVVSLPMHANLSRSDVQDVIDAVTAITGAFGR